MCLERPSITKANDSCIFDLVKCINCSSSDSVRIHHDKCIPCISIMFVESIYIYIYPIGACNKLRLCVLCCRSSVDKGKGMNYIDSKRKTLSILIGAFKRIITDKPRK